MEQEGDSHVRFDYICPGIVEGKIGDKYKNHNLDFNDRESHSNTGLCEGEMRRARNNAITSIAYPGSNGERHQVRVQTWLCLCSVREVIPTVWPVPQKQLQ